VHDKLHIVTNGPGLVIYGSGCELKTEQFVVNNINQTLQFNNEAKKQVNHVTTSTIYTPKMFLWQQKLLSVHLVKSNLPM